MTSGGDVLCWGSNDAGQIGNGSRVGPVTRPFRATTGATAVSCGPQHSCAIVDGGVACWGSNAHFESGGTTNPLLDATLVPGLPATIVRVSAGGASDSAGPRHTCAIDDTGAAHCWGEQRHPAARGGG
ncbi:MAG: RCC1 domain-containing protein [Sandaracinaceae bacterium]|nr:RCC1 domain-containing protein [Sandaracinaceae bacterium]